MPFIIDDIIAALGALGGAAGGLFGGGTAAGAGGGLAGGAATGLGATGIPLASAAAPATFTGALSSLPWAAGGGAGLAGGAGSGVLTPAAGVGGALATVGGASAPEAAAGGLLAGGGGKAATVTPEMIAAAGPESGMFSGGTVITPSGQQGGIPGMLGGQNIAQVTPSGQIGHAGHTGPMGAKGLGHAAAGPGISKPITAGQAAEGVLRTGRIANTARQMASPQQQQQRRAPPPIVRSRRGMQRPLPDLSHLSAAGPGGREPITLQELIESRRRRRMPTGVVGI